jgi:hypothetical protein
MSEKDGDPSQNASRSNQSVDQLDAFDQDEPEDGPPQEALVARLVGLYAERRNPAIRVEEIAT